MATKKQKPSLGRIVHAVYQGDAPRVGIITDVLSDTNVNLAIFDGTGRADHLQDVPLFDEDGNEGPNQPTYWVWPEKE